MKYRIPRHGKFCLLAVMGIGLNMSCVSNVFASVHCCLVVTCWKRAYFLALVGDVYCIFVTFPCGILGQAWCLIVSFPDLCSLSFSECFEVIGPLLYAHDIYMYLFASLFIPVKLIVCPFKGHQVIKISKAIASNTCRTNRNAPKIPFTVPFIAK